jgi:hypothetical protein
MKVGTRSLNASEAGRRDQIFVMGFFLPGKGNYVS